MSKVKQIKPIKFTIHVPIYNCGINVIITPNREYMAKSYTLYDKPVELSGFGGAVLQLEGFYNIMWLAEVKNTPESHSTANHEILHCVAYIMRRCGIPFSEDSEEAWTHLNGYITEQFYTKYEKIKAKLRKSTT